MTNAFSLLTRRKINPSRATGISTWYHPPQPRKWITCNYYYTIKTIYYGALLSRRRSCISPLQIAHATCTLHPKVKLPFFVANGRHPIGAKKLAPTVRKSMFVLTVTILSSHKTTHVVLQQNWKLLRLVI